MENPDQTQEAYDLARGHIAAAKEGGELGLNLSPRNFDFDGKTYAGDERFAHLTTLPPEIAELTARQGLSLANTQVADIAPLAGLTALQTLDLESTQVVGIALLAKLEELRDLSRGHPDESSVRSLLSEAESAD